jgi:hypothetical protein
MPIKISSRNSRMVVMRWTTPFMRNEKHPKTLKLVRVVQTSLSASAKAFSGNQAKNRASPRMESQCREGMRRIPFHAAWHPRKNRSCMRNKTGDIGDERSIPHALTSRLPFSLRLAPWAT